MELPILQVFPSLECNLKCPYCSQIDAISPPNLEIKQFEIKGINDYSELSPTHFYISGGEPLINISLNNLLEKLFRTGHKVSFDTNGVIASSNLQAIVERYPIEFWGFFNISHHFLANVPIKIILRTTSILRKKKIPHFVKYIAAPNSLNKIINFRKILENEGTGTCVTILETFKEPYFGRKFPVDYTFDELKIILDMVVLITHGLQFFGGVRLHNQKCYCPSKYAVVNMKGNGVISACCHHSEDVSLTGTSFKGDKPKMVKCTNSQCHGDLMFIVGVQGIYNEIDRFNQLIRGPVAKLGIEKILKELNKINEIYPFVQNEKFKVFCDKYF